LGTRVTSKIEGLVLNIRKAEIKDVKEISRLVTSLSKFYQEDKNQPPPAWFLKTLKISEFESRVTRKDFVTYLYIEDEDVVGYIAMQTNGHLYHLFVKEEHQGKGISRTLWELITSKINSQEYSVNSSIHAIPVYAKFGFIKTEPVAEKDGVKYQPMKLFRK